jgi:hypothetical protein
VEGDIYVDSDTLLVTDFMNFKIKPSQSFKYVLIGMNVHVWVFIKKHHCLPLGSIFYFLFPCRNLETSDTVEHLSDVLRHVRSVARRHAYLTGDNNAANILASAGRTRNRPCYFADALGHPVHTRSPDNLLLVVLLRISISLLLYVLYHILHIFCIKPLCGTKVASRSI